MTDISNWHELVHCTRVRWRGSLNDDQDSVVFSDYVSVPLNAYQMGNLLDALTQARNTGDWWLEFCSIVAVAMEKAGIKELRSNTGKVFKYEDVCRGNLNGG